MKRKQSSPPKDELGKIDFIPKMKSKIEVIKNIDSIGENVKEPLETCMSIFFTHMKGVLPSLAQLQREARVVSDE